MTSSSCIYARQKQRLPRRSSFWQYQVRALLDNAFAPVTFAFGFVEGSFELLCQTCQSWRQDLDTKFGTKTEVSRFSAPLSRALPSLEPLMTPLDRYLITETRSNWNAIFSNGLRVNDVFSPVSYLPEVLRSRGITVSWIPDYSKTKREDAIQIYGAASFALYGAEQTDWLNRIRAVSIANDVSGWTFSASGEVQPYEETDLYKKRRIADRLTSEMLERYCRALGIELFDSAFYGPNCFAAHLTNRKGAPGPSMSIAEAHSHLYLQDRRR